MLQAQSLPDTGWPTYCLSPLFFLHNSTHQIHSHHHHSVSSAVAPPPPHSSSSYLRELGGDQSFVGPYVLLQPALLHGQGNYLLSPGRQDGVAGAVLGGGYHVVRPGIQSDAGWSSGGRSVSLTNWLQHPQALFPSPFHSICPSYFSRIPFTTDTLFCHSIIQRAITNAVTVLAANRMLEENTVVCLSHQSALQSSEVRGLCKHLLVWIRVVCLIVKECVSLNALKIQSWCIKRRRKGLFQWIQPNTASSGFFKRNASSICPFFI